MKKIIAITGIFLAILMTGCATNQVQQSSGAYGNGGSASPVSPAQNRANQIQARIAAGNKASADCTEANRKTPAGQVVVKSILILNDAQENKLDLLASKAKLNESQKKAFKEYLATNNACRKSKLDGLSGTPYYDITLRTNSEQDLVYAKLLAGQISVGEANVARQQIVAKTREDSRVATADLNADLQRQKNIEAANRQRVEQEEQAAYARAVAAQRQESLAESFMAARNSLIANRMQSNAGDIDSSMRPVYGGGGGGQIQMKNPMDYFGTMCTSTVNGRAINTSCNR